MASAEPTLPYAALRARHQRGTLAGVARAVDGSLQAPAGRSQPLVEVAVQFDKEALQLFDAWRADRLPERRSGAESAQSASAPLQPPVELVSQFGVSTR